MRVRNETVVDEGVLEEILGFAERQVLYDLSNAVILGNARDCIELIAKVVVEGRDLCRLSRDLVEHFRNLLVVRLAKPDAEAETARKRANCWIFRTRRSRLALPGRRSFD